jgi:hypothetical protein
MKLNVGNLIVSLTVSGVVAFALAVFNIHPLALILLAWAVGFVIARLFPLRER